jgi:hypothetical protein
LKMCLPTLAAEDWKFLRFNVYCILKIYRKQLSHFIFNSHKFSCQNGSLTSCKFLGIHQFKREVFFHYCKFLPFK